MAVDLYAPCPCGSGKKLKFCCAKLADHMDKVMRMMEGEQFAATLQQLDSLEKKHPDNRWLLGVKAIAQLRLNKIDESRQTVDHLVEIAPEDVTGLSLKSVLSIASEDPLAAINPLQDALLHLGDFVPQTVIDALLTVASVMAQLGYPAAARAHLVVASFLDSENEDTHMMYSQLMQSPSVPILFKEHFRWHPAPEGQPWSKEFEDARHLASEGCWKEAARRFEAIKEQAGSEPLLLHHLGLCYTFLAKNEQAVEALRKYGELAAGEDAVEVEALAQLLAVPEQVDVVGCDYDIPVIDKLLEEFSASEWLETRPIAREIWTQRDEVPPQAIYSVLDRPKPKVEELTADNIPRIVAAAEIYGATTDRKAYLHLSSLRTPEAEEGRKRLAEIAGDAVGEAGEEKVFGQVPAEREELRLNYWFPQSLEAEQAMEIRDTIRRRYLFEKWPNMPRKRFDGKTAAEAAQDEKLRTRVRASILLLREVQFPDDTEIDYNQLYKQLNLEPEPSIDPSGKDMHTFPLVRMERVEVDKLSNEQLISAYLRCREVRASLSQLRFGREILRRPVLIEETIDEATVYRELIHCAPTPEERLELLEQAREKCSEQRTDKASWDLIELPIRLFRMSEADQSRVPELIQRLTSEYNDIPEVRDAVFRMFLQLGLITPDGQVRQAPPEQMPREQILQEEPPLPEEQQAGALWTPGSAEPKKDKPKIWTPGME